jgi:hypothetical protein
MMSLASAPPTVLLVRNLVWALFVLVLVGMLSGVAFNLGVLGPLGLDPVSLYGLVSEVNQSLASDRAVEEKDALLRVKLEGKYLVAHALADGRLDLLEAGACFRDLNLAEPSFDWDHFRQGDPLATSDDERHCRAASLLSAGIVAAERGGEEGDLAACRFEGELWQHLQAGTLRLREPPPAE